MEWITEIGGVAGLSGGGLFLLLGFLVVRGFITGKVIPESMHDRVVKGLTDQITTQQAIIDKVTTQVDLTVEYGETTVKLLQAIAPREKESP